MELVWKTRRKLIEDNLILKAEIEALKQLVKLKEKEIEFLTIRGDRYFTQVEEREKACAGGCARQM